MCPKQVRMRKNLPLIVLYDYRAKTQLLCALHMYFSYFKTFMNVLIVAYPGRVSTILFTTLF